MSKVLTLAWKELYITFRDRNLILIMFLTPIVLSTIMGLAFGGPGSGEGVGAFADIPIAVVNLDEGFNLADQIATAEDADVDDEPPDLGDLTFEIGGETISLGEQLQLNANLAITDADLSATNVSFNFGDLLAGILLSTPITATGTATTTGGFTLDNLTCPLLADEVEGEDDNSFSGNLEDLLAAAEMDDMTAARAAVDRGEFVAAVIIPVGFSQALMPQFDYFETATADDSLPPTEDAGGTVEVYANAGQPISASIVRAVVEGIVNQLVRVSVAIDAVLGTSVDMLLEAFDLRTLDNLDLSSIDPALVTGGLQSLDASILNPLACLLVPGAGNVQLEQQPLDTAQTRSTFAFIMVLLGSAQAIFFAMFTGIFGINSIYQEQDNWTLQRLVASPTPRSSILAGKLLGNVVVVTVQLLILFAAFTAITSLVEGEPTFIWGANLSALLAVIVGIALFVSGLGVLVVGLARTPEQVRFVGPMVASTLGALGGAFGFRLPSAIAAISPVWWGSEALERLSNGEIAALGLPLLVLFSVGISTFAIGTVLFRRRLDL